MKTRTVIFSLSALVTLLLTTGVAQAKPTPAAIAGPAPQATNPPYLAQFPSAERIKADVRGVDAMETAAKQAGIFWQLHQLISNLAYSQRRTDRQFTADEQRLIGEYRAEYYRALEPFEGKVAGADKPRWFELHTKYEMDTWLRDEVFKKYFTPELRRAVYSALKGQMPTENPPEGSRLTPPAGSSTAGTDPRRTPGGTGPAAQPSAPAGGSSAEDSYGGRYANGCYYDRYGGAWDDHGGYTWEDGSFKDRDGNFYDAATNRLTDAKGVVIDTHGDSPENVRKILQYRQQEFGVPVPLKSHVGQAPPGKFPGVQAGNAAGPRPALKTGNATRPPATGTQRPPRPDGRGAPAQAATGTASRPPQPGAPAGDSAEDYIAQGANYFEAEDYAKAIEAFKKAINLEPSLGDAHFGLGRSYYNLNQFPEALTALEAAARLMPNEFIFHYWIGMSHKKIADNLTRKRDILLSVEIAEHIKNSASAFDKAVRLKPDDSASQYELGYAYYLLEKNENAVKAFNEVIRLNPNGIGAHYYLGRAYVGLGKKNEALQVYRRLLTLDKQRAQELYAEINKMK